MYRNGYPIKINQFSVRMERTIDMAHEITSVDGDLAAFFKKVYSDKLHTSFVKVDSVILPEYYKKFVDDIENFEVRDDDIWVCSFPKTGTTWTQEMVWCIASDLDFERAKVPLSIRFPFLEYSPVTPSTGVVQHGSESEVLEHLEDSTNFVRNLSSPRFIKTHLDFNLLPRQLRTGERKPKIVYVVRNAKDTCISYYHHTKFFEGFKGSFQDFCDLFIKDEVIYAPFWKHVLGYWERRMDDNILFIKYEDMKKDLPWVIQKVATFLGKNLTTDQLSTLTEHLSFASMKKNPATNNSDLITAVLHDHESQEEIQFMRSGNTEQWKAAMAPEYIKLFENWTRESLKGTGLHY